MCREKIMEELSANLPFRHICFMVNVDGIRGKTEKGGRGC